MKHKFTARCTLPIWYGTRSHGFLGTCHVIGTILYCTITQAGCMCISYRTCSIIMSQTHMHSFRIYPRHVQMVGLVRATHFMPTRLQRHCEDHRLCIGKAVQTGPHSACVCCLLRCSHSLLKRSTTVLTNDALKSLKFGYRMTRR